MTFRDGDPFTIERQDLVARVVRSQERIQENTRKVEQACADAYGRGVVPFASPRPSSVPPVSK